MAQYWSSNFKITYLRKPLILNPFMMKKHITNANLSNELDFKIKDTLQIVAAALGQ
jgi:hypothetical protein